MEEDLKIVLTSELEADEQASARRISAQLPNIAKLINSRSNIKVGVTLDESNIQSQTQKLTQQIAQVTKAQGIGVSLSLDQSSVNKIRTELNNLKVNPDISRAMTDQLDQMGIQIDKITGRWEEVNGQQERMLNLTIQGTDQMGRTVTYLQTYDTETGNINTHLTNVTANLEKQRNAQEQLAKQAKADNESRVSYLTKQQALLADIQATYMGATSAKPVTNDSHLTELNNTYSAINAQIQSMIANEGKLDSVQRSNLEAQISGLKRMVKEYQNAEYVATKLRTKDIGAIKSDQLSGLEALEKRLEAAGTLTDTFRQKIDGLKISLNGVSNKDQLVSFLNSFDQLNNDVSVFQERLRGVNNIFTQLIALDKQITTVQSAMVKLDPKADENKLVALRGQLTVLNDQRASLEAQLAPYSDIVQYAKQATALEQSRLMNGSQLVYTQMEMADKAREYDTAMQRIPTTIADLNTKFKQVVEPTETLVQNMKLLRETASQYNSNMGDREKIQTYERLQQLIGLCSKEMSELMRVQRGDVNDFKFTQNLEKAKADLATVGRTWSALRQDPGLNAQFLQLTQNLKTVNNQMDLNKWTAQFSAFKSEVKAAGKNMQSLGDILKNNVSKVLQWVSATTLLFRAFRLLRTALSTIIDLDTAMVDLQKVTVATRAEYDRFYRSANDTAKVLGVTTEEVISQTAEWARLGYAMQDAAKLAENSAIFKAISPGMDITMATDGLVSMLKAFDEIDVNDSLDGIISKVNDVGNKFAVSNKDIVEAMTRTSSAMKAANNTFEETVALATAAIEITRDAASVGNGLKTLSMRIRGYDEETEEYSNDVAVLTGAIADLTKVASNGNRGVSIFEPGDPETYRSTYDILADIADIWDEMTDKNRANLLEVLFGKRQAQIGSAILSNFDQARKAIEVMEDSAGSARQEMEKIEQSLEYKLNDLRETWVGVAQNLFQTDDMKLVVDVLTTISGLIDNLTSSLGLFGTVGLISAIALLNKFRVTMDSLQNTVLPVVSAIKASGVAMDGSATSVQFYAVKLMGLDKSQRAAAMSVLRLTAEQKKQVIAMQNLIASAQKYTIQELAERASTDKATAATLAKNMAKATEKRTTDQVTAAMMTEILNSKKLTAAQKQAIIAALEQTVANEQQAFSWKAVGANAKAALAAMATNPMTWISLGITLIMGLVQAWESVKQKAEEARQAMVEAAEASTAQRESLEDLIDEYKSLASAGDFDQSSREQARDIQQRITDLVGEQAANLDLVNGKLGDEITKLDEVAAKTAESNRNALETRYISAQEAVNKTFSMWSDALPVAVGDAFTLINKAWEEAGRGTVQEYFGQSKSYGTPGLMDGVLDGLDVQEQLEQLQKLQDLLIETKDLWYNEDSGIRNSSLLTGLESEIQKRQTIVDELNTARKDFFENEAIIDQFKYMKANDVDTQETFDSYIAGIQASTEYSNEYKDILIELATKTFPEFAEGAGLVQSSVESTGDAVQTYRAKLGNLTEVLDELRSAYDIVQTAESEMAGGGGLSADTIESLASAEANYLDYLYEENGVVKLNIEAWKERANAKMLGEMDEIQKEIDSLNEENATLEDLIATYEEKRLAALQSQDLTAYYDYYHEIDNLNAKIQENNAAIEENQGKLAIYSSLYGSITGDLDAYTSALQNFSNIANSIDSITGSFQTLANLQAEVANGFTMSLDKALEFAKVYPEIMNSAQVAANGQITLNKDVVNSFIEGKKAELDAQIDSQIAQLEADKAVLNAKLASAQAQLELAKNVGEGEGQISKETAEYRINVGNALTSALIDMGVDEATAFQLAAAAMAEDEEEFARVAKGCFENMDDNAAKAAYNMAHAIFVNADKSCDSIADIAAQAHQTAKAISAMGDGDVAGSAVSQFGGSDGTNVGGLSLDLYHGEFKGTEYDYDAKTLGLDDYVSQLELDISAYQDAITQIDGQIAALQALKNAPLKSFKSSGTGSSGGSSGSTKEVEEYVASVDEYREAVERLRKAQAEVERITTDIDNAGSIEKKIALEKELIGAYQEEQAALHNLNNLRDGTVTAGVKTLQDLGFAVKYNADTNELWVENLEHLNELTADSKGQYGSLQEATNALRKDTEELINTITDLNEANREGSATWWEVQRAILDAQIAVCEFEAQLHNNVLTLTENWLDNAISQKNSDDVKRYTTEMIANYKALQEVYHKQAEALRAAGYSDTTDEIVKLSDAWWDLEDKIKDAKDKVVDYFVELVDAANDAVDSIQNVSDVLSDAAQEFADNDGWISVDTYQAIIALGAEYMQMLVNENNELVINRERINGIIEAKTRQLAVEQALSYVERLRLAATGASNESLDQLCFATTQATNSTWGLVYAELALMQQTGLLNGSQYQAALHNIQAIQSLAETAVAGIGQTAGAAAEKMDHLKEQLEDQKNALEDLLDDLEDMKDGCDDLVKYVMDMLKDRIQQQIDALNDAKKAVKDYVDQLKEAMRAEKENVEYEDELADKLKAIAKLQSKIDALSLDDSRKAQAEKMALEEELAELQKDLADFQADHAMDVTEDALDKQYEAYEQEKDAEIEKLEESISSTQKLYDMAIKYIKENWDTLYQELLDWNYEYGNSLNSEITAAWEAAQEAASRYGDFVTAIMGGIENEITKITAQIQSLTTQISNLSTSTSGNGIGGSVPNVVGTVNTDTSYSDEDMKQAKQKAVSDVVSQMRALSSQWHTADKATQKRLEDQALRLGSTLASYGVVAHRDDSSGTWYIDNDLLNPSNVGKLLYSCYHTGGFVGEKPLKPNERYVKAENGELILTSEQQDGLAARIDSLKAMTDVFSKSVMPITMGSLWSGSSLAKDSSVSNVTTNNNQPVFHITETITCVPEKSVESHQKISRDTLNEIARQIRKP